MPPGVLRWGTEDAEMVFHGGSPELSKVPSFFAWCRSEYYQYIALHAAPADSDTDRSCTYLGCLVSAFPIHSPLNLIFPQTSLNVYKVTVVTNTVTVHKFTCGSDKVCFTLINRHDLKLWLTQWLGVKCQVSYLSILPWPRLQYGSIHTKFNFIPCPALPAGVIRGPQVHHQQAVQAEVWGTDQQSHCASGVRCCRRWHMECGAGCTNHGRRRRTPEVVHRLVALRGVLHVQSSAGLCRSRVSVLPSPLPPPPEWFWALWLHVRRVAISDLCTELSIQYLVLHLVIYVHRAVHINIMLVITFSRFT